MAAAGEFSDKWRDEYLSFRKGLRWSVAAFGYGLFCLWVPRHPFDFIGAHLNSAVLLNQRGAWVFAIGGAVAAWRYYIEQRKARDRWLDVASAEQPTGAEAD